MTHPFFVVGADELQCDTIELTGDEGRHAVVVRRTRVGERVLLTDGKGAGAECAVVSVSRAALVAEVRVRRFEPLPEPRLVVVQAIPKGDHAERVVDLLTEIGVDTIVPWAASRNVVVWRGETEAKALRRWRSVAHAAAKQSRRLRFPEVTALQDTGNVAALVASADLALVLDEGASGGLGDVDIPQSGVVILVVGPEGGVTEEEASALLAAGARSVRIGPTVLRTSSAGMAAAAALLAQTPRWA